MQTECVGDERGVDGRVDVSGDGGDVAVHHGGQRRRLARCAHGRRQGVSACLPACLPVSVCLCLCVAHSRTVVHVNIQAVPLSCDHKPSRPDEMKRIEKSGGFVMHLGVPRVNGVLAVSRALGDAELKHLVPSQPEYRTLSRRCVVPEVSQPE